MKFTLSTKPFIDGLNLAIVNSNISKFYQKSCLAQVTADKTSLKVNLEASYIASEIRLKGVGDEYTSCSIFVDSLLLKQLVSTIDSPTLTLEFAEGGLILHSGKSKFTLPKMIDDMEIELTPPSYLSSTEDGVQINKANWKFVKDYQMYAVAMSFIHPVYTKVWVGENNDVVVGDFDNSIFTHSKKSQLSKNCLLSDTIINLFNSLPEGAKLYKLDKSYIILVVTDGYEFCSEFTPQYESDEGVGSYNSEIILGMMIPDENNAIHIKSSSINKFLNQALLLSNNSEDTIKFEVKFDQLSLIDNNIDCKVSGIDSKSEYCVEFKTSLLKSVISNMDEDDIQICPMYQDDVAVGIVIWTNNLTTILAGVD